MYPSSFWGASLPILKANQDVKWFPAISPQVPLEGSFWCHLCRQWVTAAWLSHAPELCVPVVHPCNINAHRRANSLMPQLAGQLAGQLLPVWLSPLSQAVGREVDQK